MEHPTPEPAEMLSYVDIPKRVKNAVLSKIFQDLHNASNLHELLNNIDQIVQKESGALAVLISIYDPYREELIYHSSKSGFTAADFKLKLGEGLAGKVAVSQSSLYVDNLSEFALSKLIYEALGINSGRVLAIPLTRRGALLGVVEVFFTASQPAVPQETLEYLDGLSHQMAIALNYFKRSEQLERKSLEEEKLAQVSQRISGSLDMDELLDIVIDALRSLIPYDAAGIYLLERRTHEIQRMVVYGYRSDADQEGILEVGRGARQLVEQNRTATILRDFSRFPWYVSARNMTRSAMVAPILSNNRLIGVFTLESDEQDVYTGNDLALFEKFTHQAALSIEKAQLHQALLEKNKLERELSIARQIQISFLPSEEPRIAGFDLAGLNIPSQRVSGDYYDFIRIVEGQWGIVIGDVSGKGIPASLIMASFRASLLAEIRNNYAIGTIMSKVNKLLWESTDSDQFVTAFYGVLDERRRILTYCNAGHNPVFLIRADRSTVRLETGGLVLGAFDDSNYQEGLIEIKPHDVLLLYTDGVTEIYDEAEEEFGVERLLNLVRSQTEVSAREITLRAKENILEFAADRAIQDDFTLVILKAEPER
jgi:sigma-B regulation protein RsbU (phosphoserine phosphatase)